MLEVLSVEDSKFVSVAEFFFFFSLMIVFFKLIK